MASQPPSFGSVAYWEERFAQEPATFEWLREPTVFRRALAGALAGADVPRILHVGCGTSNVSFFLRTLVDHPSQVHNVDFSRAAVALGEQREAALLEDGAVVAPADRRRGPMRWSCADLLSFADVRRLVGEPAAPTTPYHVIVDKSTSDAIACGEDICVTLPHFVEAGVDSGGSDVTPAQESGHATSASRKDHGSGSIQDHGGVVEDNDDAVDTEAPSVPASPSPPPSPALPPPAAHRSTYVHPLHVLALHLAYVTVPGGHWITLSYAQHRFPFLRPHPRRAADGRLCRWVVEAGFVHPQRLWRVVQQRDLRPREETARRPRRRRRMQRDAAGPDASRGTAGDSGDARAGGEDEDADEEGIISDDGDDDDEDDESGSDADDNGSSPTTPRVVHTLYVLERTAVPLRAPPIA